MSKLRCLICNKKISIIDEITSKCKCNNYYCIIHKYPENHNCIYDYVKENQELLEKKIIKLYSKKNIEVLG
jgi:predicted nucleic acid binding AN1-type Zn finger protein